MKILITSGRSFVALDFVRILQNHEIFVQESQEEHICKKSCYVRETLHTKSPKYFYVEYKKSILKFVKKRKIDIIIPTCEDIFYISQFRDEITELGVKILSDSFEKLRLLHSKKEVLHLSEGLGISIPQTKEFKEKKILKTYINSYPELKYVVKPQFSRFAHFISSNAITGSIEIDDIKIDTTNNSYLLQQYIAGKHICSYSIFQDGNLVSHMAYKGLLNYKNGSTTYFETFESEEILNFVKNFSKKYDFSGQISFDFIIKQSGEIFLIECNPRTTSGIHLLKQDQRFLETFEKFLLGKTYTPYILNKRFRAGFLGINFLYTFTWKKIGIWVKSLCTDVIFDKKDRGPFFSQFSLLKYYKRISKERNITLSEVTSYDIEYDGI